MTAPNARDHMSDLNAFRLNDMGPFCLGGEDTAETCMRQAHALSQLLPSALSHQDGRPNDELVSDSIGGIGTLIALSYFALHGKVAK